MGGRTLSMPASYIWFMITLPNEPLAAAHRVLGHWLEGNSSEQSNLVLLP